MLGMGTDDNSIRLSPTVNPLPGIAPSQKSDAAFLSGWGCRLLLHGFFYDLHLSNGRFVGVCFIDRLPLYPHDPR